MAWELGLDIHVPCEFYGCSKIKGGKVEHGASLLTND